jgi:cyclomaltodextrinase / maltogenic alpha-amylase / neopullulanase
MVLNPSRSHKYNISDYEHIDPDFGDNEYFRKLVEKAHSLGIKVMIDAVFNHSGRGFFAWQDVVKNGKNSKYYDWYFVKKDNFSFDGNTKDGRYYSLLIAPFRFPP